MLSQIRAGLGVGDLYNGDMLYGPLSLAHVSESSIHCTIDYLTDFQGLGYCMFILYPLGSGVVPTFVDSKYPLTAEAALRHLAKLPTGIAFLPPALLEDVVALGSEGIDAMRACKRVIYAGAPLRQSCGDALASQGVPLVTGFGM